MTSLEYAIELTRRGLYVFRLVEGTKNKFIDAGWANGAAMNTEADMRLWWEDRPFNVAVLTRNVVVLDIDCKDGVDGYKALESLPEMPRTFRVKTPSGGLHIYFRAAVGKYGQSDLAPGINVRATNGYVLGPGATYKGKRYEVQDDAEIAELPDWLGELLSQAMRRECEPGAAVGELDTPDAIERARRYLDDQDDVLPGARHGTLFKVAARLGDMGISEETALDLIEPWHEERCDPPLEDWDWRRQVSGAYQYRKKVIGIDNPAAGFEPAPEDEVYERAAANVFAGKWWRFDLKREDEATIPQRPWLAAGTLLRGKITLFVAPGGTGKSLLTIQWAAALALGDGKFTGLPGLQEPCNVAIINNEDELDELRRRAAAVFKEFGLDYDKAAGRLHFYSGAVRAFKSMVRNPKTRELKETPEFEALATYVRENAIKVLIIDPLVSTHTASENSNEEMNTVVEALRSLATATDCAILIVHHTTKPPQASAENFAGNINSARGATAIKDGARIAKTLYQMTPADGDALGVQARERHRYVRLDDAKANLHLASPDALWFAKRTVHLDNGETVGVLVPHDFSSKALSDGEVICKALASHLIASGGQCTVNQAATVLAEHEPLFSGMSADTIKRRVLGVFDATQKIEVECATYTLEPAGRGGTIYRHA